jgi:hypothetical protein
MQLSLVTELIWQRPSVRVAGGGRRCLFGLWEVPGVPGSRFFSKSQRWETTAGPEQSSVQVELIGS